MWLGWPVGFPDVVAAALTALVGVARAAAVWSRTGPSRRAASGPEAGRDSCPPEKGDGPVNPTDARDESHPADPVHFGSSIRLTKREAFDACQVLADADRFLLRAGRNVEASALGDLFELFEERLTSE
jgi:hypothetical protein